MSNPSRSPITEAADAAPVDTFRRIEVITGVARRRAWPADVKAAIVMETLENGARVSKVARRHGVAAALVFKWRREMCSPAPAAAEFAQIAVAPASVAAGRFYEAPPVIEAEADGVRLRIPSNASRDAIMAVMEGLAACKRRR